MPSGLAKTVLSIVAFKNRTKDPAVPGSHGIQYVRTHQKSDCLLWHGARWEPGECGRPDVRLSEPTLGLGDLITKVAAVSVSVPCGFFGVLELERTLISGQQ